MSSRDSAQQLLRMRRTTSRAHSCDATRIQIVVSMQAAHSEDAAAAAAMDEQPGAPLEQQRHDAHTTTIEQIEGKVQQMEQRSTRSSSLSSDVEEDSDGSLAHSCDEGDPSLLSSSFLAARAASRAHDPEWAELHSLVHKVSLLQRQSEHLTQLSSLQKQMIEKHTYRPQHADAMAASASAGGASSVRASAAVDLLRNPFTPIQQLSPINPYLHPQYAPVDELKSAPVSLRTQQHSDAASNTAASAAATAAATPASAPRSWANSPHSSSRSVSSSAGASAAASPVPVPSGSPEPSRIRSQWEMRRSRGTHDSAQDDPPRSESVHLLNLADVRHPSSYLADSDEQKDDGALDDDSRSSTHRSPRRTGHHTVSVSGDEDDRASVTFSQYAYSGRGPPSVIGSVSSSLYAHHAPSLITSTIRSGSPSTVSVGARSVGARSINGGPSVDGDDSHATSEQLEEFEEESTLLAEIDEDDSSSHATDEHSTEHSQKSSSSCALAPRAQSFAAASAVSPAAASARFVASSPPLTASSLAHLNRPSSRSLKARLRMREQLQREQQQVSPRANAEERDEAMDGGSSSVSAPLAVAAASSCEPTAGSAAAALSNAAPSIAPASMAAPLSAPLSSSFVSSASFGAAATPRQQQLGSIGQSLFLTIMQQIHNRRRQTQ